MKNTDFGRFRKIAALVLTMIMASMMLPCGTFAADDTSSPVIPGLSDGGSLASGLLGAPAGQAGTLTVTFDVGADALAAGVQNPSPLTVDPGETLANLPYVGWRVPGNEDVAVKYFSGWYTDEALSAKYVLGTPVTADMTLYAKWSDPADTSLFYVNYLYVENGAYNVVYTVAVDGSAPAFPMTPVTLPGKLFRGWSTTPQNDGQLTGEIVPFDFTTVVSAAATGTTLNLYAWYGDVVNVHFHAKGGHAVPTRSIARGEDVDEPTTTNPGYTFRGWSTDEDTYTPYNFSTPVMADIDLYAFWTPQNVPFHVAVELENANDEGYTPGSDTYTFYAPAGSYVSVVKTQGITDTSATHQVMYSMTEGGEPTEHATTESGANATIPDVYDTYFQFHGASNNHRISGETPSTIQAWYNRVMVTLTFTLEDELAISWTGVTHTNPRIDVNAHVPAGEQAAFGVTYNENKGTYTDGEQQTHEYNESITYTFTAKYEQDIRTVYPRQAWVETDERSFYGWTPNGFTPNGDSSATNVSNRLTLEEDLFGAPRIVKGVLTASGNFRGSTNNSTSHFFLIYARQTLPRENADFTYGGRQYTIQHDFSQVTTSRGSSSYSYKNLLGSTPVGNPNEGTAPKAVQYRNLGDVSGLSGTNGRTLQQIFTEEFASESIGNTDMCQVLLYDRNPVTLLINTNGDHFVDTQTAQCLYGELIYDQDTDLLKTVEAGMSKANHRFAGWFTDHEFASGSEFVPTANTAITGNLELYGKWEPVQFTAEYYLYQDQTEPSHIQGFAEDMLLDPWDVPVVLADTFDRWEWYVNGVLEPFDFGDRVGENVVDRNGVLKLYAAYTGNDGHVEFLPGIGGDNATQTVVDPLTYTINQGAILLPEPTAEWPTGVPTNPNLHFVGWKAPNGTIYQAGRYVLVTRPLMDFEAQWSLDTVTLTYSANGGNGADVTETWAKDSEVTVFDNMDNGAAHFTRDGYDLLGWSENANATTADYALGTGKITLDASKTLYAVWKRPNMELTVRKEVAGITGDTNQFNFTIVGHFGGAEVLNDTFTLTSGSEQEFTNLPIGTEIVLTETNASRYRTSAEYAGAAIDVVGESTGNRIVFTLTEGNELAVVTNTIRTGLVTVTNNVTGNIGEWDKDFTYNITYEVAGAPVNATFTLQHGDTWSIPDPVPYGTAITVVQTAADGYTTGNDHGGGMTATTTVHDIGETITFVNNRSAELPTGVRLDKLPYIVIIAAVIAAAVILIVRKLRKKDDDE